MYAIEVFLTILILACLAFGATAVVLFVLNLFGLVDVFGEREVLLKKIRTLFERKISERRK